MAVIYAVCLNMEDRDLRQCIGTARRRVRGLICPVAVSRKHPGKALASSMGHPESSPKIHLPAQRRIRSALLCSCVDQTWLSNFLLLEVYIL